MLEGQEIILSSGEVEGAEAGGGAEGVVAVMREERGGARRVRRR